MKYLLNFFLFVLIVFTIGCFEEDKNEEKEKDPCENVTCETYKTCVKGVCILNDNKCETNIDCETTQLCNSEHNCISKTCDDNQTDEQSCGLNNNGTQKLKCINNEWVNDGDCVDVDECLNETVENIDCGYSDLGNYQRKCENGTWSVGNSCSFNVTDGNISSESNSITDYTIKNNVIYYVSDIEVNGQKDVVISKKEGNITKTIALGATDYTLDSKITIDNYGNVYVTGKTLGSFGEYVNNGSFDIFIAKYNSNLEQQWIVLYGNAGNDIPTDIVVFNNELYVSGNIDGEINTDGIVLKYNTDGVYQWEQHTEIFDYEDEINSIDIDNEGNLYSVGQSYISDESSIIVVTKYDVFFDKQWVKEFGETGFNFGNDIQYFAGNIYISGATNSSDFYGNTNKGGYDAFIIFLDNAFNITASTIGSESDDFANKLSINGNGDIFIYGTTRGAIYENSYMGGSDVFFVKYDYNLNAVDKLQFGSFNQSDDNMDSPVDFFWDNNMLYFAGNTNSYFFTESLRSMNSFFAEYESISSCVENEERYVYCQYDSTLIRKITCNEGNWENATECIPVPCISDYDKKERCGLNNRGYKLYTCENDMWVTNGICINSDECVDGTTKNEACGTNGTQSYICTLGQWEVNGSCSESIKQYGDVSGTVEAVKHKRVNNYNYILGYAFNNFQGLTNSGNNNGTCDILVIKTDDSGDIITSNLIGTSTNDTPYDMAIDNDGNIYVTGSTLGELPLATSLQGEDAFIIKYNSNLGIEWIKQYGTNVNDNGKGIIIKDGYIYLTGTTEGWMASGQGAAQDIFIMKLDMDGTQLSVKQIGSNYNDFPSSMVEFNNNLYITGESNGRFDSPANSLTSSGFIIKIDLDLTTPAFKQFQASSNIIPRDITVDALGNIFITGVIVGSWEQINTSGASKMFIAKYDNQLNFVKNISPADNGYAITSDSSNNIHVLGVKWNLSASNYDVYYYKTDSDLNYLGELDIISNGNTTTEYSKDINIFDNKIYMLGSTSGTFDSNDTSNQIKIFLYSKGL